MSIEFERHLASQPGIGAGRVLVLDPQAAGPLLCRRLRGRPRCFIEGATAAAGITVNVRNGGISLLWCACACGIMGHREPAEARQKHIETLTAHHRQLEVWAENCPENFENRAALVGAEIARIDGRAFDAMDLYEQAIRSAQANGFVHNEALANELAARFYAACGFEQIAHLYLRNARRLLPALGRGRQGAATRCNSIRG